MKKNFKFICFVLLILSYFLIAIFLYPILIVFPYLGRNLLSGVVSFFSQIFLLLLGIKVSIRGLEVFSSSKNYLIVSNHLSYLDVLIISSIIPSCFVTSKEIKDSFFLGQIVTLAGCLFVDRRDKRNLKNEIGELRDALRHNLSVTIFPEATSTNGNEVIRFRRPLFESSIATGKPILPLTINYKKISSRPVNASNRDIVCWYGDMDFLPHFLKVLEQDSIDVELVFCPVIIPEMVNSLELAIKSHQKISNAFQTLNRTEEVVL